MSERRARDEREKSARRRQLLDAAADRLDRLGYGAATMSEIAVAAGLAKGTTYLYFRSKEALFLELLLEALEEWCVAALAEIEALRDDRAERVAARLAATVSARGRFVALLPLRHPVLEQGAASEEVERHQRLQLEALAPLALALEERLPTLGLGGGSAFLLRFLALATGSAGLAGGASPERRALGERPETARLARDFETELAECSAALLRGWRPPAPPASATDETS
ncbi:MAG: TetR family transcriptional regulator [Acidobacteria bacterium]|nr:TetR family transcriptional regulator [Acidobacteriota bacterium]